MPFLPAKSGDTHCTTAAAKACRGAAFGFVAACVAATAQARGFRAECEARLAPGDVAVTPVAAPYQVNRALGVAELTATHPPATRGHRTLGLTTAHVESDIRYEQNGLRDPSTGGYCMRPRFSVTLSYSPIEVFVAREIPEGSCGYREVLRHEERHVAAYREQLAKAVKIVAQTLRAHYSDTIFYGDTESVRRELADTVKRRWLPLAQRELQTVERVHHGIDSPQEYRHNQTVCNGELNAILKATR